MAEVEEKKCSTCAAVLPVDNFYKKPSNKDGREGNCKKCRSAYHREWRKKNPESYKKSVEKWASKNPRHDRVKHLRRTYGITVEQYVALKEFQHGLCAICHHAFDDLVVDHDHQTNVIRGLLCRHCNIGLGAFRDKVASLVGAIEYLKSPPAGIPMHEESRIVKDSKR